MSLGNQILEINFYCKYGEVDIIYKDNDYLVFGEVKYRKTKNYGSPIEAVSYTKQKRITSTALFYLMKHNYPSNTKVRFDIISILGDDIHILKNAFEPTLN